MHRAFLRRMQETPINHQYHGTHTVVLNSRQYRLPLDPRFDVIYHTSCVIYHTRSQPPKRPGSPMSGEPLRPKDLIPVIFTLDSEKAKVRKKESKTTTAEDTKFCPCLFWVLTGMAWLCFWRYRNIMCMFWARWERLVCSLSIYW